MSLLREWLAAIVPLHILELRRQGGPLPKDFAEAQALGEDLGHEGDVLLFFHSQEITQKEKARGRILRARLARALAVGAFVPGGVRWNGLYFCEHPECGMSIEQERAERDGWYAATYDAVKAVLDRHFGESPTRALSRPRRSLINSSDYYDDLRKEKTP
jgi:hypothetical protein